MLPKISCLRWNELTTIELFQKGFGISPSVLLLKMSDWEGLNALGMLQNNSISMAGNTERRRLLLLAIEMESLQFPVANPSENNSNIHYKCKRHADHRLLNEKDGVYPISTLKNGDTLYSLGKTFPVQRLTYPALKSHSVFDVILCPYMLMIL